VAHMSVLCKTPCSSCCVPLPHLLTRCDCAVLSWPQPETAIVTFLEALLDNSRRLTNYTLGTRLMSEMEVS
jgi:hypothetical protein